MKVEEMEDCPLPRPLVLDVERMTWGDICDLQNARNDSQLQEWLVRVGGYALEELRAIPMSRIREVGPYVRDVVNRALGAPKGNS